MNYFEFYKIPINLLIDPEILRNIYLSNSRKYHPDFHTLSNEDSQKESLALSDLNNRAYKVLKDIRGRIKYILDINHLLNEGQESLPPEFLMEMMDLNELMEVAQEESSEDKMNSLLNALSELESGLEDEIEPIMTKISLSTPDLTDLKSYYLKRRYFDRLKENLEKK